MRIVPGILILILLAPCAFGQAGLAPVPNQVRGDELTPAATNAIRNGLAWLATRQQPDGAFGVGGGGYGATSAITALSSLAFMEAGNLPTSAKNAAQFAGGVKYITHCASGIRPALKRRTISRPHVFPRLCYAFSRRSLRNGSRSCRARNIGKRGETNRTHAKRRRRLALHAGPIRCGYFRDYRAGDGVAGARDAGVQVDHKIIDNAISYVRHCQNPDGGFSYMANMNAPGGGGGSAFERSSAGVAALYYAGVFQGNDLRRGLDYVFQFPPQSRLTPQRLRPLFLRPILRLPGYVPRRRLLLANLVPRHPR